MWRSTIFVVLLVSSFVATQINNDIRKWKFVHYINLFFRYEMITKDGVFSIIINSI